MGKKALIAMSGGVDSSVAALLMKEQGHECVGVTMKLYDNEQIGMHCNKTCCSLDDINDARGVAFELGMPFYVFNFMEEFEKEVIQRFIAGYEDGLTPNPCIDCNRYMKFEYLYHRAKKLGYDYVVTGHYVRIEKDEKSGRFLLKKALDETKDQSYVLYAMTQEQLAHSIFPLGGYRKTEIREIAQKNGFLNAKKRDSQDICFVPDGDYSKFIKGYTKKDYEPGDFIDLQGNVLGTHKGMIGYTIGQRKGLGLALKKPMYVHSKKIDTNEIILCEEHELYKRHLVARDINLIAVDCIKEPTRYKVKIRYSQAEQWATVTQMDDNTLKIEFDKPQRAITIGQAVVIYDNDIVVGGGTIL